MGRRGPSMGRAGDVLPRRGDFLDRGRGASGRGMLPGATCGDRGNHENCSRLSVLTRPGTLVDLERRSVGVRVSLFFRVVRNHPERMVPAMNIGDSFRNVLDTVINFLPNLAVFLVILVVGWIVAKVLRKVVNMVLDRLHFDRAVERGGIQRALARSKYDASGLIAAIVYYAVLLMALQMGFAVFGPNPVSNLLSDLVAWLPMAVVAIVIVVVACASANAVKDIAASALGGFSWGNLVARVAQGFIIALGVIAALNQMGVATTVTPPVLVAVLATVGGIL